MWLENVFPSSNSTYMCSMGVPSMLYLTAYSNLYSTLLITTWNSWFLWAAMSVYCLSAERPQAFFPVHTMYIPLSVVKVKQLRFQKADHFCLKGFSCFHRFSHSTWGLSFQKRKCSQMTAMKGLSSSFRSEHLKELAYLSFLSDTDICWKVWLCTYTWCCSYTWAQIWVSTISYCVSNVLVWILAEWEKLWWLYFLIPHMSLWWGENSFFF